MNAFINDINLDNMGIYSVIILKTYMRIMLIMMVIMMTAMMAMVMITMITMETMMMSGKVWGR